MKKPLAIYIDEIESIEDLSTQSLNKIKKGILSSDSEIRYRSFEKLAFFKMTPEVNRVALKGLLDSDEVIRSNCIEILAELNLELNLNYIIHHLDDFSTYVVNTCIVCLADIEKDKERVTKILKNKLNDSLLSTSSLLRIHFALYKLEKNYSVNHLLDCLIDSRDYRDRCAILNLLDDYCKPKDIKQVKSKLAKLIDPDDFMAVLSSYKNLLASISKLEK